MKLNTAVWGEQTINVGGTVSSEIKSPAHNADLSTYQFLYQHGYIQGNTTFDQSPLYGVSFDKTINSIALINNGVEYSLLPYSDCGFYISTNNFSNSPNEFIDNTVLYHRGAYDNSNPYNNFTESPVSQINFTKLVHVLYVVCTNSEQIVARSGTHHTATYDEYINNTNNIATNYPIIIGAYLRPYYGKAGSRAVCPVGVRRYQIIHSKFSGWLPYDVFCYPQGTNDICLGASIEFHPAYDRYYGVGTKIFWGCDGTYFEVRGFKASGGAIVLCPVLKVQLSALLTLFCKFGVYFTTSVSLAQQKPITDKSIFIGTITDTGTITGNPRNENKDDVLQNNWNDPTHFLDNNGFNGIDKADPNTYVDKVDLNKPALSVVNVFNRTFALNNQQITSLADFLWNADETKFDEIIKGLGLMGENPMNGLIDLRLYPFDVAVKNDVTAAQSIVIGRTDTGVKGIKLTGNVNALIDLGSCSFFQKFKNFLDYEPYTTAQLYIPYIGVVPVSTAEFMGHNISVKMIVDYITGACTAIVFKDDIPFIYRNGVIGVSVPMTGTDSSSYSNAIISSAINTVTQGANAVADFAGKNVSGGISDTLGAIGSAYSAFSTPVQYQSAGASSPSVATWQPQNCYFIIDRPVENVPSNYGHTIGYACEETGTLNSFSGFTVISNPEISFKTTDVEKQMLINMLTGGVFV